MIGNVLMPKHVGNGPSGMRPTFAVKMDLTFLIGQTYASKKLEQNALKMLGASLGRVVEI